MALFFLADPDKQGGATPDRTTQIAGTASPANFPFKLDRWVSLGKKMIKPGSINFNGTVTYTIPLLQSGSDADVAVDYESGLVMIKSTNTQGIVADSILAADFIYGSCSLKKFVHRIRPMTGFLRYRGTSEQGPRHEVQCWKVQIVPDSAMNFIKPSDYATLGFSGDVYIDDDTNTHRYTDPFFGVEELDATTEYPLS
jgi:hypothetical protein